MGRTMMMSQATAVGVEKIGEQYDEGGINNMKALQKASKFLSDYTSIVVIAIAVVTFFVPSMMGWVNQALFTDMVANKFTSQSVIIGIIMFSMGLTLTTEDFKILAQRPFDICVGAIAQYLIMPFLAFALTKTLHLPDGIALGLILVGWLSWWCIIQYHVLSVRWRCSIFCRNDNSFHVDFTGYDTADGIFPGKWNKNYDSRTSDVCIYY